MTDDELTEIERLADARGWSAPGRCFGDCCLLGKERDAIKAVPALCAELRRRREFDFANMPAIIEAQREALANARRELSRYRPVVEAAKAWHKYVNSISSNEAWDDDLNDAVDALLVAEGNRGES